MDVPHSIKMRIFHHGDDGDSNPNVNDKPSNPKRGNRNGHITCHHDQHHKHFLWLLSNRHCLSNNIIKLAASDVSRTKMILKQLHLVKRMSCIAVLCGQEVQGLEFSALFDSCLSSNPEVFPLVDDDPDGNSVWHGCYLTFDPNHHSLIRSGMTVQGFEKRWKQHVRASWLNDTKDNWRNIYLYYPHPGCDKQTQFKRGTCDQLQQRIGVGFDNSHKSSVVELFEWSPEEEAHLGNLFLERDRVEL
jgi:hypothetical protein